MSKNILRSKHLVLGAAVATLFTATVAFAEESGSVSVEASAEVVVPAVLRENKRQNDGGRTVEVEGGGSVRIQGEVKDGVSRLQKKTIRVGGEGSISDERREAIQEMQSTRDEAQKTVMEIRKKTEAEIKLLLADTTKSKEEIKIAIDAKREEMKKAIEASQEAMKAAVVAKQGEFRKQLEENKEATKEEIAEKRAEMKKKLEKIKNEQKKKAVERIDEELIRINGKHVAYLTSVIERLDGIVEKIDSRTDKAEVAGKNVTSVRVALTTATTTIAVAREKIAAQSTKTYTVEVTTEVTLRAAVEKARLALKTDLTVVREAVKAAHVAVRAAATVLVSIPGINTLEEASN